MIVIDGFGVFGCLLVDFGGFCGSWWFLVVFRGSLWFLGYFGGS